MPLSRCFPLALLWFFSSPIWAQTPGVAAPHRDPQAVAVVEAAIKALGGTAISQAKSWAFQSQTEGSLGNGARSEVLAVPAAKPASLPRGEASPKPPAWARPRSLFVPALVGRLLVEQLQGKQFSIELQETPPGAGNISVVVFSFTITQDRRAPAQIWHFDRGTGLPKWIWFIAPVRIGEMESLAGASVLLSDYRAVGGVLYPHRMEMDVQRTRQRGIVTFQSVTPSATAGGAQ